MSRLFSHTATYTSTHTATDTATDYNTFSATRAATHCNTLQHAATCCNTLQHIDTRINTSQSWRHTNESCHAPFDLQGVMVRPWHRNVWYVSFMCVMTHLYVRHDLFIRMMWLIHMRDMTHQGKSWSDLDTVTKGPWEPGVLHGFVYIYMYMYSCILYMYYWDVCIIYVLFRYIYKGFREALYMKDSEKLYI